MNHVCTICALALVIFVTISYTSNVCDESSVWCYNAILDQVITDAYNPKVIPWNRKEPVIVREGFTVEFIINLNEKEQILTSVVWHDLIWNDSRLAWNPADYDGVEMLHVPADMVWKPDLMLYNSVGPLLYIFDLDPISYIVIWHTGQVVWYPIHRAEILCQVDTTFYPYDTQECSFWISSWTLPMTILEIIPFKESTDDLTPNSTEWDIISIESGLDYTYTSSYDDANFIPVKHTIRMKRNAPFFAMALLIPCLLMTVLIQVIFLIPANTGDRRALAVAVWTSLVLFLMILIDSIPGSSSKVPVFGLYSILMLLFTTVTILMIGVSSRLHTGDIRLCLRMRWFLIHVIAPITRYQLSADELTMLERKEGNMDCDDNDMVYTLGVLADGKQVRIQTPGHYSVCLSQTSFQYIDVKLNRVTVHNEHGRHSNSLFDRFCVVLQLCMLVLMAMFSSVYYWL